MSILAFILGVFVALFAILLGCGYVFWRYRPAKQTTPDGGAE